MKPTKLAKSLFEPDRVALIGASSDLSKPNGRPLKYLLKHGYGGTIYPVNPRTDAIGGVPCFPNIESCPAPVDHAFIMLSADAVPDAVRDCAAAGVACATVLAGGFSEAGEAGRARQADLVELARSAGIRLLGPNSIGLMNPARGLALSANAMLELPTLSTGGAAVVSQSGSLIGALLSHGEARDVGFSKLISVGNEADLTVGEIGDLLVDDPVTDVILLFLETLRDRDRLATFARNAHKAGKPVIAYRVGRTGAGQALAQSHTGSLASSDKVLATFLAHHGIAEVSMFDSLIEAPRLFAGRRPSPKQKGGVAIVTTTGGGGAMVVDNLAHRRIDVSPVPATVIDRLREHGVISGGGLVDLTMAGAKPEVVRGVISDLMATPEINAVAMVVGSSARFHPDLAVDPLLDWAGADKPLAVYLVPDAEESLHRLARGGVPVFRTPEACADALSSLLRWQAPVDPVAPGSLPGISSEAPSLTESRALKAISELGIAVAPSDVVHNAEEAGRIAAQIGFPVAIKIASADIAHKSEVGGVQLNLRDSAEASHAYETIMESVASIAPDARIEGALVQGMVSGLAEVILGYKRDLAAGPFVMVGAGGVLAELYDDTSVRVAPVSPDVAREMIEEVVGLAPIRGYRGLPLGDLASLTEAIVALSTLAGDERIAEAEINPLVVGDVGEGVVAADALIIFDTSGARED